MTGVMMRGMAPHRHESKLRLQWSGRVGTICRNHSYSGDYWVKWDDRKSIEPWPAKALEKIHVPSDKPNGS